MLPVSAIFAPQKRVMISDNIIRQKFVIDGLKDAAESAFRFMSNSFNKNLQSKTNATIRALTGPDYIVSTGGDGEFIVVANVTKQLRFQDLGFRRLYMRPLYGALKHVHGKLQYGLQDDIRENIRKELENALNPE